MANTFAWVLFFAVVITGILWGIDRWKLAPKRKIKVAEAQERSALPLDKDVVKKLAKPAAWLETCTSIFPILLFVFVVRSFLYEPFQIPSGSMMPTLLVGDFILVNKFSYGIRNPLTQAKWIETGKPQRGDIVVFKYPQDPKVDYIKRIIGVPGDRVIYDSYSKQVTIQSSCQQESSCQNVEVTYGVPYDSDFVLTYPTFNKRGGYYQVPLDDNVTNGTRIRGVQETIGNVSHQILNNPDSYPSFGFQQPGQMIGVYVVPKDSYFVMGDNRDDSLDSRFWGFVPEQNLVGKATAIWMSFEKQEGEWPTGTRFSRIGSIY